MARLTVSVTTRDRESHMIMLLTCLYAQTYNDFDILIMNNGERFSNGALLDILELHRKERGVQIVEAKGHGVVDVRQEELNLTNTEFLFRTDDDVVFAHDYLAGMMEERVENASVWFSSVANDVRVDPMGNKVENTSEIMEEVPLYSKSLDLDEQRTFAHAYYKNQTPVEVAYSTGVFFAKTEEYKKMVKYDPFFNQHFFLEDTDLNYGVVFNGGHLYFHPKYRLHHCCSQDGYKRSFQSWVVDGTVEYLKLKVANAKKTGKYEPVPYEFKVGTDEEKMLR